MAISRIYQRQQIHKRMQFTDYENHYIADIEDKLRTQTRLETTYFKVSDSADLHEPYWQDDAQRSYTTHVLVPIISAHYERIVTVASPGGTAADLLTILKNRVRITTTNNTPEECSSMIHINTNLNAYKFLPEAMRKKFKNEEPVDDREQRYTTSTSGSTLSLRNT